MTIKRLLFLTLVISFVLGCGRKVQVLGPYGPAIQLDELSYREGLAAFNEGRPEGYLRAARLIRAERQQFTDAIADLDKAIDLFTQQIKTIDVKIAAAAAKPQSRFAQAERKRAEREKQQIETEIQRARELKAVVEQELRKNR